MTTTSNHHNPIEHDLTQRLTQLAHTFIADLTAQGHLIPTPHTSDTPDTPDNNTPHPNTPHDHT
ncbi:hypothetical protein, partial [Streptomyces chiangmaiensis]